MSIDVWIPLLGGVLFQGLAALMTICIPETLPLPSEPLRLTHGSTVADDTVSVCETDDQEPISITKKVLLQLRRVIASFSFMTEHQALPGLVFTFLISKIGSQSTTVLYQYVSKRYGWPLSQVSAHNTPCSFVRSLVPAPPTDIWHFLPGSRPACCSHFAQQSTSPYS